MTATPPTPGPDLPPDGATTDAPGGQVRSRPPNLSSAGARSDVVRGHVPGEDGVGPRRLWWTCIAVGVVVTAWALLAIPSPATYGAHTTADEPQYLLSALSLAEDRDLWIEDELADSRYEPFHEIALPVQTEPRGDGHAVSPHDPLLPVILAVPMGLGGWVAAKATLALLGGALAGLLTWTAQRRFGVSSRVAVITVLAFGLAAPFAPYATQVYPELPAALAVTVVIAAVAGPPRTRPAGAAIAAGTEEIATASASVGGPVAGVVGSSVMEPSNVDAPAGERADAVAGSRATSPGDVDVRPAAGGRSQPLGRAWLVAAGLAIVSLPWLGVKYAPVAAVLALVCLARLWQAGRTRAAVGLVALGLAAIGYLVGHRLLYGGWTVYAAGDHFVSGGELSVVGSDPNHVGRSQRLVGLLLDRSFGLAAWMPGFLLAVPALAALLRRRPGGSTAVLVAPLVAGWATATWVALTMHGWWWPGRQTVVVLPCLILAVAWWVDQPRLAAAAVVDSALEGTHQPASEARAIDGGTGARAQDGLEPAPEARAIDGGTGARAQDVLELAPGSRAMERGPEAGSHGTDRPGLDEGRGWRVRGKAALDGAGGRLGLVAATGAVGAVSWLWVAVEAWRERLTLIVDFDSTSNPLYRGWRLLLPDYRHPDLGDWLLQAGWLLVLGLAALLAWRSVGARPAADRPQAGGPDTSGSDAAAAGPVLTSGSEPAAAGPGPTSGSVPAAANTSSVPETRRRPTHVPA